MSFLDEERVLPSFLRSIADQTRPPDRLLLVDDGSRDGSAALAEEFARRHGFASLLRRPVRPAETDRLATAAELRAFNWAWSTLDEPWELVAKLDADLSLPPGTLASVEARFRHDPGLGIAGPRLRSLDEAGRDVSHRTRPEHVEGAVKFYRRECLEQIKPIPPILGWDTIDEVRARMRGWRTAGGSSAEEPVVHLRARLVSESVTQQLPRLTVLAPSRPAAALGFRMDVDIAVDWRDRQVSAAEVCACLSAPCLRLSGPSWPPTAPRLHPHWRGLRADRGEGWSANGGSLPGMRDSEALDELRTPDGRRVTAVPADQMPGVKMPDEFEPNKLARRTLQIVAVLAVVGLALLLAPGLGEVRDLLTEAQPEWVALAVVFEAMSCASYVLMFRPIFCQNMPWRTSWEIGLSELAAGSIVPASGAGGLALGAWILREGGMPAQRIASRSVAFFLIKSSVNFVAVAVLGTVLALGLLGANLSLWLTAVPAAGALLVIAVVLVVPRMGVGAPVSADAGRTRKAIWEVRKALVGGTAEAVQMVRSRNLLVIVGALGYWAWDNAVLWATFHAFGYSPPITVILLAYLIGQLGGLLPLPGGLGGIDGGLIGTLIVYGIPAAPAAAAVLVYRVILFWLPLLVGGAAFISLRRALNKPERPELCVVPAAT